MGNLGGSSRDSKVPEMLVMATVIWEHVNDGVWPNAWPTSITKCVHSMAPGIHASSEPFLGSLPQSGVGSFKAVEANHPLDSGADSAKHPGRVTHQQTPQRQELPEPEAAPDTLRRRNLSVPSPSFNKACQEIEKRTQPGPCPQGPVQQGLG